jgi:hypothetical protein
MTVSSARLPSFLRLAFLVLAQIIVALSIVELLGQAYFGNPNDFSDYRFLFTSPDSFRNVEKFWTYSPNAVVKEVAMYQTALGGVEKEYDCDYRTDRLGFVDNQNSSRRDFNILLLGDSFAQGQGGCPWASKVRQYLPGVSIYNAGLQGTGPGTWAPIARYLLEQGLRFRTALVIFISDDLRRHLSNFSEGQLGCLHDIALCHGHFFYPMPPGLDITRTSSERAQGRTSLFQRTLYFWEEHLWVTQFLASRLKHLVQATPQQDLISDDARNGLDWLTGNFPRLRFVRILTKDELALKSDNAATLVVERYLRDHKIDWAVCDIGYDGFLHRDVHPNREGYERLARCISRIVADVQTRASMGTIENDRQNQEKRAD